MPYCSQQRGYKRYRAVGQGGDGQLESQGRSMPAFIRTQCITHAHIKRQDCSTDEAHAAVRVVHATPVLEAVGQYSMKGQYIRPRVDMCTTQDAMRQDEDKALQPTPAQRPRVGFYACKPMQAHMGRSKK